MGVDTSTIMGLCESYVPLLGPHQVFCGVTAAILLRMPLPHDLAEQTIIHVGARNGAQPRRGVGVRGHRLPSGADIWRIGPLLLTSPIITWGQLSTVLSREDLTAVGDYMVSGVRDGFRQRQPLASIDDIRMAAASCSGNRGAKVLRWASERVRGGVDSRPETLLRLLLVSAGFEEPVIGLSVLVDSGALTLHPDLAWTKLRIVFEYEGDGHRESKQQFRHDIRRRELFEAAGWRVIRVTADDLGRYRALFLRRVRASVAARVL